MAGVRRTARNAKWLRCVSVVVSLETEAEFVIGQSVVLEAGLGTVQVQEALHQIV